MSALGLCPGVHDCDDPNYSIRIRMRIRMYENVVVPMRGAPTSAKKPKLKRAFSPSRASFFRSIVGALAPVLHIFVESRSNDVRSERFARNSANELKVDLDLDKMFLLFSM